MTASIEIPVKLTPKQEHFCLFYFALRNASKAALKAGYSPHTAPFIGSENLRKPQIISRLAEMEANRPPDKDIADIEERKRRLTEIYRANLVDFQDANGEPTLSRDIPHHGAASEYSVSTTFTKKGESRVTKSIKLLNPIAAIQEHNKMERIGATDTIVNFNEIKVLVVREETKALPVVEVGEVADG